MGRHERIERAIDACYEAILVPGTWPDALHGLARSLDAACVMFYPRNPDSRGIDPRSPNRSVLDMPISHDFRDLLTEYIRNNWFLNHYRAERGFPLLDSGRIVVIEDDLSTADERRRLRHYNELYLPFGFPGFAMAACSVEGMPWAVPMLKGKGQGQFTREDAQYLATLLPHFRRLIALSERLVTSQGQAGLNVLGISCAAFLLDWRGTVMHFNSRAGRLLGIGLSLSNGRLHATWHESDAELQRVIQIATRTRTASALNDVGPVVIARHGRRPLLVDVLPTIGLIADVFQSTSAILVVSDLDERPLPSTARLRNAFGLTAAEARVASHLSGGHDLDSIADEMKLSRETVRVHLKNIYFKTDTHRQAELVSLVTRIYRKDA
ncbi:helix-turn-helix transcriptional regulator [Mesorhizobium sp. LHD-90]|uniref:helix-turn-helix transcriptional regulator n=1 Tax=Mesorhizobium sp. LHD-90 TaxID=3071414 RepID=UPI0027DF8AF7|nr:helix-turn-helix transcriptional regulator [Mesorhizobium sp. LHD-90]MDQ6434369.1 helix-turn-helix transcriptional regulator [Mesorhizobium sp. LHD-90]